MYYFLNNLLHHLTWSHSFSLLLLMSLITDPNEHLQTHQDSLYYWSLMMHLFHRCIKRNQLTWSQVSRIMTSSVARSSWVISPGTSSICMDSGTSVYYQNKSARWFQFINSNGVLLTIKRPVLLEQANSLGGWAFILSLSLDDVR